MCKHFLSIDKIEQDDKNRYRPTSRFCCSSAYLGRLRWLILILPSNGPCMPQWPTYAADFRTPGTCPVHPVGSSPLHHQCLRLFLTMLFLKVILSNRSVLRPALYGAPCRHKMVKRGLHTQRTGCF